MKRYDLWQDSQMYDNERGEWVKFTDAEALRLRAEKAEAERDALAARLAEIEKGSWGRVTDDDESGYPSFDDWFDALGCDPLCDWKDGAIVTWERFGPLPSERYRIRRNVDADGCVSYTYEEAAP